MGIIEMLAVFFGWVMLVMFTICLAAGFVLMVELVWKIRQAKKKFRRHNERHKWF